MRLFALVIASNNTDQKNDRGANTDRQTWNEEFRIENIHLLMLGKDLPARIPAAIGGRVRKLKSIQIGAV